ncbi:MAG: hypothetical protein CMN76_01030 [Spirochaetaceae bacterium]|nr:hypothetical protein [Spirochaetaceae bacterium]
MKQHHLPVSKMDHRNDTVREFRLEEQPTANRSMQTSTIKPEISTGAAPKPRAKEIGCNFPVDFRFLRAALNALP